METLIIYKSIHHGNTEKIAKSIAEVLESDLSEPEEIEIEEVLGKDLVGFGSGIYYRNFHESIMNLIEKLPRNENKKAFLFSTSGLPKIPVFHEFGNEVKEKLNEKGYEIIGHFSCRGWDTYINIFELLGGIHKDRPNEKDLEEAQDFAKQLTKD